MDPAAWEKYTGLYMLQPYDPNKIPVVFVHGLMSSPTTWAPMLNGLMGDPVLREHYQFWFFRYPTGNPVLYSAESLHAALDAVQRTFDRRNHNPAFQSMVVVGHSMGGLLTKTLTQDSGEAIWNRFSKKPLDSLTVSPDVRNHLDRVVHFTRRPYVSRVLFLAVPHRGSELALGVVGAIGRALITLPLTVLKPFGAVVTALAASPQPGDQVKETKKRLPTGVDSLSPKSPVLKILTELPIQVPYHSIIGNEKKADTPGGTDGVVPYWSSHLDGAVSEKIVHSGHNVHTHPLAIREVRRILLEHLKERGAKRPAPVTAPRVEAQTRSRP
jgi:pimeloyl-ACP methyl ester carboxylesterase